MLEEMRSIQGGIKSVDDARSEYFSAIKDFYGIIKDKFTWVKWEELKAKLGYFYYVLKDEGSESEDLDEGGHSNEYDYEYIVAILSAANLIRDVTILLANDKTINNIISKMKNNEVISGKESNIILTRISKTIISELARVKSKHPDNGEAISLSEFIAGVLYNHFIEYAVKSYGNVKPYTVKIAINKDILENIYNVSGNVHVLHSIVGRKLYVYYVPDYTIEIYDVITGEKKTRTWLDAERESTISPLPFAFYEIPLEDVRFPRGVYATGVFELNPGPLDNIENLGEKRTIDVSLEINPIGHVRGMIKDYIVEGTGVAGVLKGLMLREYASRSKGRRLGRMNTGMLEFALNLGIYTTLHGGGITELIDDSLVILGPDSVFNDERIFERVQNGNPKDYVMIAPPNKLSRVNFQPVKTANVAILDENALRLRNPENGITLYITSHNSKYNEDHVSSITSNYIKLREKYITGKKKIKSTYSYVYPLPPPDTSQLTRHWRLKRNPIQWVIIGGRIIAYTEDGRSHRLLLVEPNPGDFYSTTFKHYEKENPRSSLMEAYAFINVRGGITRPGVIKVRDLPVMLHALKKTLNDNAGASIPAPAISFPFYDESIEEKDRVHAYLDNRRKRTEYFSKIDEFYSDITGLLLMDTKTVPVNKKNTSPFVSILLGLFEDRIVVILADHEVAGSILETKIKSLASISFNYKNVLGDLELTSELKSETGGAGTLGEWVSKLSPPYNMFEPCGILVQPFTYYVSSRAFFTGEMKATLSIKDGTPYVIVEPPFRGVTAIFKLSKLRVK